MKVGKPGSDGFEEVEGLAYEMVQLIVFFAYGEYAVEYFGEHYGYALLGHMLL